MVSTLIFSASYDKISRKVLQDCGTELSQKCHKIVGNYRLTIEGNSVMSAGLGREKCVNCCKLLYNAIHNCELLQTVLSIVVNSSRFL
jgi:hypothetical protein